MLFVSQGTRNNATTPVCNGSWAAIQSALAPRPLYLRQLPTCYHAQVGSIGPRADVAGRPMAQLVNPQLRKCPAASGDDFVPLQEPRIAAKAAGFDPALSPCRIHAVAVSDASP
jgi:hypothetical protein